MLKEKTSSQREVKRLPGYMPQRCRLLPTVTCDRGERCDGGSRLRIVTGDSMQDIVIVLHLDEGMNKARWRSIGHETEAAAQRLHLVAASNLNPPLRQRTGI